METASPAQKSGANLLRLFVHLRCRATHGVLGNLSGSLPHRLKCCICGELGDGLWKVLIERIATLLLKLPLPGRVLIPMPIV